MSRNFYFSPGEFYHVYNRGTEKRKIFLTNHDYKRFLNLLYLANNTSPVPFQLRGSTSYNVFLLERKDTLVDICAYCLMPNHFHLIIHEKEEGGISRFMQKLTTGYTMYFNTKNERNGSLFQGRFKASHVDSDRYLTYLIAYLHLNPIKIVNSKWKESGIINKDEAREFLDKYEYSSYLDYCGMERIQKKIIDINTLPNHSETPKDFKTSIESWLNYSNN